MKSRARIVILNGIGSVGKSSTAKALQTITSASFLHVAMDTFLAMLPEEMLAHPDGLTFRPSEHNGKPVVTIKSEAILERALRGMRHAVAAIAEQGNNIIVDEVMLGPEKAEEYRDLLRSYDLYLVGLMAPLDILEARELARGDRMIGLARGQFGLVHRGITYDLELDTSAIAPAECARAICDAFGL